MRRPKLNRLALNRGYLCGAMDRVTDGGIGWRQDLIKSLKEQKAPIDIFGVGTSLVTGEPDAALDGVYKLGLSGGEPRLKISENISKITLPGRKQVFRLITADDTFYGGDVITLGENDDPEVMHHPFEPIKSLHIKHLKKEPLLVKVMEKGKKISGDMTPTEISNFSKQRLTLLPDEFKRFDNPHVYKIGISDNLKQLKSALMEKYRSKE